MENINLNKEVYQKDQYTKIIDTSFSQLTPPPPQPTPPLRTNEEIKALEDEVIRLREEISKLQNQLASN